MSTHQPFTFGQNKQVSNLEQQLETVWGYIDSQNIKKAVEACRNFNQTHSSSADGWFATSFLAFQLRDATQALLAIDKAIKLAPKEPKWQVHKAQSCLLAGDKKSAQTLITSLITQDYQDPQLCAELALVLNKLALYPQASRYYEQAIELAPNDAGLYFNLASIQRYLGKIHKAEVNLNWAISINPNDYEAYLQRASLRKQTKDDNHVEQLQDVLNKGIVQPIGKAQVCYALAKECEDLSKYQQSFDYLSQGADVRRKNMKYDVNNDIATLAKIADTFDDSFFREKLFRDKSFSQNAFHQESTGDNTNQAIFILGLPRTGSTLIERIISSHSQVNSAGELNDFAIQMMTQVKAQASTPPRSKLELIAFTKDLNFKALGQAYTDSTQEHVIKGSKFIDKLPLNSLYAGLIHLALPQAKIIHVKRNPLDTIYAMYKQLFTNGYPFSYDLTELTQYYIAHHKLMSHWHRVMPEVIHQVNYEDVLNNVTSEAKKLVAYCQLEWQEQCSDFHQNQAPSTTASASQVREKIYTSSAGKWRHYETQLSNVKKQLEQASIAFS